MARLTRGERFKDARIIHNQHKKQTMDEVSTATGVSKSLIQSLEDDTVNRSVGYDKVAKLAAHYHVATDYLLGLSDDPDVQKSAVDDLGLTPTVVSKILNLQECTTSDCDPLGKFNRLLENENIWTLLFLIHDYITATKAESIYDRLMEQRCENIEALSKALLEVASQYEETDIDLYDFLVAKAKSHIDGPLIRLGLDENSLYELIYLRIDRQIHKTLTEIEEAVNGND